MGPEGCRVTLMLSCQVVGEVCVVVADQVEMFARLGMGEEVIGEEGDQDGELNDPGSNDER